VRGRGAILVPTATLIHFGFGGAGERAAQIRPIGRAVEGRDASEDVFAPIRWRCLRNSYVMDAMRAPKTSLCPCRRVAHHCGVFVFGKRLSLCALCRRADDRRCSVFVLAKLFDGLSKAFSHGYMGTFRTPSFSTIAEHTANPSRFVQSGLLTLRFIFSTGYKSLEDNGSIN